MKKIITAFTLFAGLGSCSVPAMADGFHHHGHGFRYPGYYNSWNWVGPTVIGGVIGYEIARSQQPVIVQQPPVIVQQPPVYVQSGPACSVWTEVQNPDGTITRTRTCTQ